MSTAGGDGDIPPMSAPPRNGFLKVKLAHSFLSIISSHQQAWLLESRVSVDLAATGTQAIQPAIRVSVDVNKSKVERLYLGTKGKKNLTLFQSALSPHRTA